MSAVYPTVKLYIDLDNDNVAETNISSSIVSALEGQSGILSYKDTDRLSSTGTLQFQIDNSDDAYTDSTSIIGKAVSVTLTLNDTEKQVFFGYITDADVVSGTWGRKVVSVFVSDWMNIASKTRVQDIALATFVTADEAITTLVAATPNPPADTDLEVGYETFLTMFDGALSKTVVYSELDKITKSELGYLYLKFREATGETLTFENYLHRGSTHEISTVPESSSYSYLKVRYSGGTGYLKWKKSGDSGKIKLKLLQDAYFDRTMVDSEWEVGRNVINSMSVTNVPRDVDASNVVLYNLNAPILIGTTQKMNIQGAFTDPNGGSLITANSVVTPVATTDYLLTQNEDGTGTDYTANLIKTFSSGTNTFSITFRNNGPAGYLTFFRVRGKGIYRYDPVETISENSESQTDIVKTEVSDYVTREYSSDYNVSKSFADSVVAINRTPISVMKSVSFVGNTSEHLMLAFMHLETGDKVQIVESQPSHTGNYYIQGIKFTIDTNGIVYYTWYLKEDVETICQPIIVKAPSNTTGTRRDAIDFGILPYLADMPHYSYSLWVKRDDVNNFGPLLSRDADNGSGRHGNYVILSHNDILFSSYKTPTDGNWQATSAIGIFDLSWHHIVVTYDNTTEVADPIIYVDGVSKTVTETSTPAGTSDSDADCPLRLFNIGPNPAFSYEYFYDSIHQYWMKDVRIYDKILTQDEVTELANNEDDYSTVQDGLVFQGIFAPTDNIDAYDGSTLTDQELVLDSVHKAVGTPYNEDTSSSTLMITGNTL